MPQHKSAKKRLRNAAKNQARNRAARSTLRRSMKALRELPADKAGDAIKAMHSLLDRAANHGLFHRNKAARLKSRFKPGA
ncbi:MAG: 30S ribosomal protein S20 [Candidatus Krumholzibacteriia bacterium]